MTGLKIDTLQENNQILNVQDKFILTRNVVLRLLRKYDDERQFSSVSVPLKKS